MADFSDVANMLAVLGQSSGNYISAMDSAAKRSFDAAENEKDREQARKNANKQLAGSIGGAIIAPYAQEMAGDFGLLTGALGKKKKPPLDELATVAPRSPGHWDH